MAKQVKSKESQRILVKKPASWADYIRIYGVKNGLLKEVKQLEKELSPS